jgi:arginyl-tRNA synthetase
MLKSLKSELSGRMSDRIRELYGRDQAVSPETPPRRELGDLAFPIALHLSRTLKRPPRQIAEEIVTGLELPPSVRDLRVEGPGFINLFLARSSAAARLAEGELLPTEARSAEKIIVEHTNINPNKAAHVGHLRNAVLGDILVRVLRALGHPVEVQNYIDDTGVQLADVVVGFMDIRRLSHSQVGAISEPFDHYCWDLYSEVREWYQENPEHERYRRETLRALEEDSGPRAEMGHLVSRRVVARHLATMRRLGTTYDLLTHESAILGLHFFDIAFQMLKEDGVVRLEKGGKAAGCWIMPLAGSEEFAGLDDPDKVIVRSDGTVTYVGKDIAYQLWKFGLLGHDFRYRYWKEQDVWETSSEGAADHPSFGAAQRAINVIDARQSYLQKIVRAGLERLGHAEEARRSVHFAYEMVSLSPGAAEQLGFAQPGETRKSLEMSGRKGIGVKADDLLDQLEMKSRQEIAVRNRDLAEEDLDRLARKIAIAALRFFMARATTTRVIAFDFDEALNFEGESGPYLQYSLVRARNIRRKLRQAGFADQVDIAEIRALPEELWTDDLWDLVFTVAQIRERVEASAESLELSSLARLALDLGQKFNAIYHQHPILREADPQLRAVRLTATQIFSTGLSCLCDLLGLPLPERM